MKFIHQIPILANKESITVDWVRSLGTPFEGGAAGKAAALPLPVVGSAQNFSLTFSIPQGCLTKNFSPIG